MTPWLDLTHNEHMQRHNQLPMTDTTAPFSPPTSSLACISAKPNIINTLFMRLIPVRRCRKAENSREIELGTRSPAHSNPKHQPRNRSSTSIWHAPTGFAVPHASCIVGAPGNNVQGVEVDVDRPAGTIVPLVRSQSLAIM